VINNSQKINDLLLALQANENQVELKEFLLDLLSTEELKELSNRWQVAKMLNDKIPYTQITEQTGMSSTTIARISKCLNRENSGYKTILLRTKN
jgi:TrpR-related protein YerC/YecD